MLVLIFALWLPWNWFWFPVVLRAPVNMDAQTVDIVCKGHVACATDYRVIFISPDPDDWLLCGSLEQIVIHELQHYLQFTFGMHDEADWNGFCDIIADMILYGDYNEHQRGTMRMMCDDPPEMHAELPILLRGEIPEELAAWYPWFDLVENEHVVRPGVSLISARR